MFYSILVSSLSLPRNVALRTFGKFLIVSSKKDKSAISPLFNDLEMLSSASDKPKLLAKNFSRNSNFDDSGIFACFPF